MPSKFIKDIDICPFTGIQIKLEDILIWITTCIGMNNFYSRLRGNDNQIEPNQIPVCHSCESRNPELKI